MEYSLLLPVLLIMIAISVDGGQLLSHYQALVDVGQNGIRLGQQLKDLETVASGGGTIPPESGLRSTIDLSTSNAACTGTIQVIPDRHSEGDPSYVPPPIHYTMHLRIAQAFCLHRATKGFLKFDRLTIASMRTLASVGGPEDQDTVNVRLTGSYRPFFPYFGALPLTVNLTGPYLY